MNRRHIEDSMIRALGADPDAVRPAFEADMDQLEANLNDLISEAAVILDHVERGEHDDAAAHIFEVRDRLARLDPGMLIGLSAQLAYAVVTLVRRHQGQEG